MLTQTLGLDSVRRTLLHVTYVLEAGAFTG